MGRNLKNIDGVSTWWEPKKYIADNNEDEFVINYFSNKTNGFLLDISAADGVTGSNSFKLIDDYNWGGILVEPCAAHTQNLKLLYDDLPDVHCFFGAINNNKESITFFEHYGKFIGHSNTVTSNNSTHSYDVKCVSINDLLEQYNAPNEIDFISLDIEGSESEVLDYFNFDKYKVKLWCIEESERFRELLSSKGYAKIATIGEINDFWELK